MNDDDLTRLIRQGPPADTTFEPLTPEDIVTARPHSRRSRWTALRALGTVAATGIVAVAVVAGVMALRPTGNPSVGGPGPSPAPSVGPSLPAPSSTSVAAATPSPNPSPSVSTSASETPRPACEPARITASFANWQGAAGTDYSDITLRNTGTVGCSFGTVSVRIVDASGMVMAASTAADVPYSASKPLVLAAGASKVVAVRWANWCRPSFAGPAHVDLALGSHHLIGVPGGFYPQFAPPCNGPGMPGMTGLIAM